ncbi:MAG TPA: multiheme c-type cytochrome [Gemmataceae bacterium]|nr:multiheme c-type cytochrome [Gemmataceae bacterium]
MSYRKMQFWLVAIVGMAVLTGFMSVPGLGQQPKANPGAEKKAGPTLLYFGVAACRNCHTNPDNLKDSPPLLCRCNEVVIWEKEDKHKDAYKNLSGPRGQQMAKLLGIMDVAKERACVACHGIYIPPDKVKELTDPASFKVEEGVSCVACHGPYAEWVTRHGSPLQRDRDAWRGLSRQAKEEQFGMTDLWDPAKRTNKCASCHIGNSEEGKVVTHAMYAAGHPPLPGVEVSTFSDAMPRHWQYLKEKPAAAQKLLEYNPAELEKTKLVVIGGVADLQDAMRLLATQAQAMLKVTPPENRSLDLAQIDCYACHHELKVPSWRQSRGYSGVPGRPQFRQWPLALVKLGMRHAGQEKQIPEFEKKLSVLQEAFNAQPFGKLDEVVRTADDLAKWCAQLETSLGQKNVQYNRAAAISLLRQLCAMSETEVQDYDTARQMAWAFKTIYSELDSKRSNDSEVQAKLKALDNELKLSLPSGQEHQILAELPIALRKISDYDPSKVQHVFQDLAKLLPPK